MITLSRRQVRSIRTMLSQALGETSRKTSIPIGFQPTDDGIALTASNDTVAIRLTMNGTSTPDSFAVPLAALSECEGGREEPVTIRRDEGHIVLEWQDAGIPQVSRHEVQELPPMPASTETAVINDQSLMVALAEATKTADREPTRYALNCLRLRGDGQIAATDGRQAYLHGGFNFPFEGEILIPAARVLTRAELAEAGHAAVAKSDDWLMIEAGSWQVWLKINKDARFPQVDRHVPATESATTTLRLAEDDARFLVKAVTRLPGARELNAPVTLDLNGAVSLRARGEDERVTELELSRSRREGEQLRFNSNRTFLARAVELGFRDIYFRGPEAPAVCRDGDRTYFWALLGKEGVVEPGEQMLRTSSTESGVRPTTNRKETNRRRARNHAPRRAEESRPSESSVPEGLSPLAEAEALRELLKSSLTRTRALIAVLRRRKRQSRLVESTLASLRQLQDVG